MALWLRTPRCPRGHCRVPRLATAASLLSQMKCCLVWLLVYRVAQVGALVNPRGTGTTERNKRSRPALIVLITISAVKILIVFFPHVPRVHTRSVAVFFITALYSFSVIHVFLSFICFSLFFLFIFCFAHPIVRLTRPIAHRMQLLCVSRDPQNLYMNCAGCVACRRREGPRGQEEPPYVVADAATEATFER